MNTWLCHYNLQFAGESDNGVQHFLLNIWKGCKVQSTWCEGLCSETGHRFRWRFAVPRRTHWKTLKRFLKFRIERLRTGLPNWTWAHAVWTVSELYSFFFFEPSAVVPRSQRSQARGATSQPREFQHWRHAEGIFWVFEAAGSESVFWLQPDIDRSVSTPLWKELHLLLGGIPRDSKGLSCLRGKRGN